VDVRCAKCGGEGLLRVQEELKVRVPAGVQDGARLRLGGKGNRARHGPAGDLYLRVRLGSEGMFKRKGNDLHLTLAISVAEALLGATVEVPTLEGPVRVAVPACTSSGQKIRLKGLGYASGELLGDLYIKIRIEVPPSLDEGSRRLVEEFAKRNPYNPRDEEADSFP
jgi:molecular chaperone DnaJ